MDKHKAKYKTSKSHLSVYGKWNLDCMCFSFTNACADKFAVGILQ